MSPEQLKTLQKLSKLFEEGAANPSHIKQLSCLLAEINQLSNWPEENLEQIYFSR
ncbi:hypothetical protein [Colwellia sp. PAMC 21821]|uniref:hypothetical protein n=1 Tax=Colwellia sp. PAMC 21821 TaxID=1816219 RepID=UPI0012DFB74F|nr:hypothetical protein [Colwellia sp. PAMC 21821]